MEIVSNTHVASIMGSKNELMPQAAEEECRRSIPFEAKEYIRQNGKECVPAAFDEIVEVIALVKTFVPNTLIQLSIFPSYCLLVR